LGRSATEKKKNKNLSSVMEGHLALGTQPTVGDMHSGNCSKVSLSLKELDTSIHVHQSIKNLFKGRGTLSRF